MKPVTFTGIPLAKRPDAQVWQVLAEQARRGQATILQDGDKYLVQFPDEEEPIPLEQLAYHDELGLHDKRAFPDL